MEGDLEPGVRLLAENRWPLAARAAGGDVTFPLSLLGRADEACRPTGAGGGGGRYGRG
jgi:hypothetical protein